MQGVIRCEGPPTCIVKWEKEGGNFKLQHERLLPRGHTEEAVKWVCRALRQAPSRVRCVALPCRLEPWDKARSDPKRRVGAGAGAGAGVGGNGRNGE
jgi:hypothetical protein